MKYQVQSMQYVLCNFRTLKCLNGVSLYSYSFQLACLFSHCLVNCYQPQLGKQFFTTNRTIDHPSSRPVDRHSQRPKPLFLVLLETNVESKKTRNYWVDTETKKTAKLWSIFFTKIWYLNQNFTINVILESDKDSKMQSDKLHNHKMQSSDVKIQFRQ